MGLAGALGMRQARPCYWSQTLPSHLFRGIVTYNNLQESYCLASSWTLTLGEISIISFSFTLFLNNSTLSPLFLIEEEIHELEVNLDNLLSLFHGNTCSRYPYPSQGTQVTLTQDKETKKVWTLQPKPSLVQLEEQLEEQPRQGAGVQPYPVIT